MELEYFVFPQYIPLCVLVKVEGNKKRIVEVQSGEDHLMHLKEMDLFSVAPEKSEYFTWEGKGRPWLFFIFNFLLLTLLQMSLVPPPPPFAKLSPLYSPHCHLSPWGMQIL